MYLCMYLCMYVGMHVAIYVTFQRGPCTCNLSADIKSWLNCTHLGLKVFAEHMLSGGGQCIASSVVESSSPSLLCCEFILWLT